MEAQHKGMLKRLVAGEFKEQAERLSATHYDPGVLATFRLDDDDRRPRNAPLLHRVADERIDRTLFEAKRRRLGVDGRRHRTNGSGRAWDEQGGETQ